MTTIKIAVHGVLGKMGQEVANMVCTEPDFAVAGVADVTAQNDVYDLPDGSGTVKISDSLENVLDETDVIVDFTNAEGAMKAIRIAAEHQVNIVVGSTGLSDNDIEIARKYALDQQIGITIAPNFAIGAVLMIHMAKVLAPFFDFAEITETHHEFKKDAPSGTALAIARASAEGKGTNFSAPDAELEALKGTRGGTYKGISIHSARMPGRVAHHELVFGTTGQTIAVRHDSINRESFMPGVAMAIRETFKSPRFIIGLESLLDL